MKPVTPIEYRQTRSHLGIVHGRSGVSMPASIPWVNDAKDSIFSLSRRLTTLIINKSKKGGFR